VAGSRAHRKAKPVSSTGLADLTPVAAEAGAAEGDPRPVYTWAGSSRYDTVGVVRSYPPSGGGAPRLVAGLGPSASLGVWDTGTGAFLGALQAPQAAGMFTSLVTYQRPSDGRPRVAAVSVRGHLSVWDGDDLQALHAIHTNLEVRDALCLSVYEEPISGSTRLVTV
jgi:hypothetical protein